jgi:hypothetical protein
MMLVERHEDRLTLQFGLREKLMLQEVAWQYPLLAPEHFRLTRSSESDLKPEDQQLLTESITTTQQDHRKRVRRLLAEPRWTIRPKQGIRLTLSLDEVELLLQVLNDVRVGSWVRLGCPDPEAEPGGKRHPKPGRDRVLLDLAGFFENGFLEAIGAGA